MAFLGPALVVLGTGALLAAGFAAGALVAGGAEDPLPAPAPAFALAAGISSGMSSTSPDAALFFVCAAAELPLAAPGITRRRIGSKGGGPSTVPARADAAALAEALAGAAAGTGTGPGFLEDAGISGGSSSSSLSAGGLLDAELPFMELPVAVAGLAL